MTTTAKKNEAAKHTLEQARKRPRTAPENKPSTGTTIAYCWRSGLLGFADGTLPDGALPLDRGTGDEWRGGVEVMCRLMKDGSGRYLVPGVPEAENDEEALQAVFKFREWIKQRALRRAAIARGEA